MNSTKINQFFGKYAAFLLKWRWAALGLFAVIMVISFIGMSKMVTQTSFDDYFIEGDPMLVKTNDFKAFGWYRIVLGIVVIAYLFLIGDPMANN